MVYGVAGEPLIVPTVWALLALRDEPKRPEFVMSLDWLERNIGNARGAASLALARIGMEAGGRKWPQGARRLRKCTAGTNFCKTFAVASWACLASCPRREWLTGGVAEFC